MDLKKTFQEFKAEVEELCAEFNEPAVDETLMVLSFSVPEKTKLRFDELQGMTKKKFVKLLKKVVIKSIDSVK